jgi:signal transduction histidine kinase
VRPRDVRIVGITALIQIGGTFGAASHHRGGRYSCWWASSCRAPHAVDLLAVVLLALGPLLLLVRRRYPREVLAAVFAVTLVYVALGYPQGPNYASLAVALVTAVIAGHRTEAAVALVAGWALFLWLPGALGRAGAPGVLASLALAAWLLVLFAVSEAFRSKRQRVIEARRAREQASRLRADEERLRIARELHDVLAHSISVINVQSGVALHLIDEQPDQARTALAAINEASADALREVRSVLGILRGTGESPPRAPAPSLDRLDELVTQAKAAGVGLSIEVDGERRPLPASVELAAFRIVQESLTNIVRHAGAVAARVRLDYGSRELTVEIDDDGPGVRAGHEAGNGIAGMRERAAALGGEFDAGPRSTGGFRVRARLPLGSSS